MFSIVKIFSFGSFNCIGDAAYNVVADPNGAESDRLPEKPRKATREMFVPFRKQY